MHVQKGLLLLLATHHPEYPLLPHLHLRSASSMRAPLPLSQLLINIGRGPILPHRKTPLHAHGAGRDIKEQSGGFWDCSTNETLNHSLEEK